MAILLQDLVDGKVPEDPLRPKLSYTEGAEYRYVCGHCHEETSRKRDELDNCPYCLNRFSDPIEIIEPAGLTAGLPHGHGGGCR